MPSIWNVGSINQSNQKKVSSKLTFEAGESFKGRIVAKGDGNQVTVKLPDGWEFPAELTGDDLVKDGSMVQLEVEGFEDGKLKLKLVEGNQGKENTSSKDIIGDFLNKEGMSKADTDILKAMIKHTIPLTKENISFVKSLVSFNGKINSNPQEIEEFINKFIAGKEIDPEGMEAQNIKGKLNDFFNSFKTMGEKDIMLFLENDIEFTKENIDSYNKIFKENNNLKEYFDNVSKEFKKLDLPKVNNLEIKENIDSKSIVTENEKNALNKNAALKIYDSNVPTKEKLSMLSLIKSLNGNDMELVKDSLKDIIKENRDNFKSNEVKSMFVKVESMTDDDIIKNIKKIVNNEELNKNTVDKAISNLLGKEVRLSENSSKKIIDIINLKLNDEPAVIKEEKSINANSNNIGNATEEEIPTKQGMVNNEFDDGVKLDNKLNKESIVINKQSENLNGVDKKVIANDNVKNNIETILKAPSTSAEIIKDDINRKIENIKDIIKDVISRTGIKGEGMEKIMDFIKSNINDFKMLNSISNEYYYLDIPVNKQGEEYPCKLIIKDNRKDSKKIDKTNVKVVVAVKTVNIGTVDGYLTINNSNFTINLKCEERFVKPLDLGKDKLVKAIQDMGFLANISVSKKVEEVSLTSCRDFFDNSNQSAIDIKV
ncbi:hypothetical protein NNC19_07760 [Clostridium sp. SHJSY1]|uniref:hypothetical protein n=1 Tax=Clostridium sp. SHJSY1 TaxID=2942483 RepID=UPI002874A9AD|nr:hypothetical protein [Clostridium sp. SHJSY1]MDS0525569.1 hypothetical protein [Clostridium sp. SHJSY1]